MLPLPPQLISFHTPPAARCRRRQPPTSFSHVIFDIDISSFSSQTAYFQFFSSPLITFISWLTISSILSFIFDCIE
jgi:hypothetical protein